jgi:transposase-like protein
MTDELHYSYQGFSELFPNREACLRHLVSLRWPDGFVCPRCGQSRGYFLEDRKLYECVTCRFQASATSGTIFHNSHVDLHKWYWLLFHLAVHRERFSIRYIQDNLRIRTYKTAWLMAKKVNHMLSRIDERSEISGFIRLKIENSPNQVPTIDNEFDQAVEVMFSLVSCFAGNNQPQEYFIRMAIISKSYEESIQYILDKIGNDIEIEEMDISVILDEFDSNGLTPVSDNRIIEGCSFSDISICNLKDDNDYLSVIETILNSLEHILSHQEIRTTGRDSDHFFTSLVDQFNFRMFNMKIFDQLISESIQR